MEFHRIGAIWTLRIGRLWIAGIGHRAVARLIGHSLPADATVSARRA